MNSNPLFLPLFIQIFLTFILLFRLAYLRLTAIRQRLVKLSDIALGQKVWPERATKTENSFNNQFQLPILFYLAILVASQQQVNSWAFVVLAYFFSFSRIIHAFIHTTSNLVRQRFIFFLIGGLVLFTMWLYLSFIIFMT